MRILKALLIGLASLVALVVVAVGGMSLYQSIDREDTFLLEQAALEDPQYLQHFSAMNEEARRKARREEFHAAAHRLKPGEGTVFAYRHYSNGSVTVIDDELYKKVSIWLPGPPPTEEKTLSLGTDAKGVLVFSDGGSAWPEAGCSGYATSGTVRITPEGSRYSVEVTADVPTSNPIWPRCETEHLALSFEAKRIEYAELTPWLGRRGDHPYAETYR